ncbi:hypothetical protein K438DRAFT_1807374 [Mycena galopus ATCC 62051]|nr:hypothetical protein K438DRAFT_1807374 [Mycena galopus ATCC 62051]
METRSLLQRHDMCSMTRFETMDWHVDYALRILASGLPSLRNDDQNLRATSGEVQLF